MRSRITKCIYAIRIIEHLYNFLYHYQGCMIFLNMCLNINNNYHIIIDNIVNILLLMYRVLCTRDAARCI